MLLLNTFFPCFIFGILYKSHMHVLFSVLYFSLSNNKKTNRKHTSAAFVLSQIEQYSHTQKKDIRWNSKSLVFWITNEKKCVLSFLLLFASSRSNKKWQRAKQRMKFYRSIVFLFRSMCPWRASTYVYEHNLDETKQRPTLMVAIETCCSAILNKEWMQSNITWMVNTFSLKTVENWTWNPFTSHHFHIYLSDVRINGKNEILWYFRRNFKAQTENWQIVTVFFE